MRHLRLWLRGLSLLMMLFSGWVLLPAWAHAAPAESPPARAGRHALIIGVGHYAADPARPVETLHGIGHDMRSARAMAALLQVPETNITELRDGQATRAGVTQAITALQARVQPGDRVFVYWSGHGSRYHDPQESACVETLIPHDLKDFTHREFARLLKPVGDKADKLFVVYDACHSGGAKQGAASRSLLGDWRPKMSGVSEQCSQPSNVKTRSFSQAVTAAGMGLGDVVHIASSRPDEVSFDNPQSGGLATQSLLQCLRGQAKDLDGSGAITADELVQCAQAKLEATLRPHPHLIPHHLTLAGNKQFVPNGFAQAPQPELAAPPAPPPLAATPVVPPKPTSTAAAQPTPVTMATPQASAADILSQLHAQRDHKRELRVASSRSQLRIGLDPLDLSITSAQDGYVYVAMAGSDGRALTLLFPNELDRDNRIVKGQNLLLPRPQWQLTAAGPAGRDRLLVMVSDGPRDLAALQAAGREGPFVRTLLDAQNRARVQWLLGSRVAGCNSPPCGDAFAAALIDLEEVRP